MDLLIGLPSLVVFLFLIALIGRLIFEWIQAFARDWRPRGPVLVVAETVFTVTDPPLKALRRVIPPLRLGSVQLDLSFMLLFAVVLILWRALPQ
ncbi:MAG: YggT family protein [Kineosporiaceae bacterium]|nr:YggT family protein [Kineosporiaceae bacterium]MBK7624597.1 YggT family protein [Kineosporiaceae bacterium]MBK8077029.1 YggT family protein [Kineosporiaceae bacterium]